MSCRTEFGKCGICGLEGVLEEIQDHFLKAHVEADAETLESSQEEPLEFHQSAEATGVVDQVDISNEWGEPETRLLLDKYESYLKVVGPMKRFKRKKDMWLAISTDIFTYLNINKTALQCENRYKTVMKRKKKAVDNNSQSGSSRLPVEYEQEINKIAALDDSIEPEILRDSSNVTVVKKQEETPKKIKRYKEKTVQQVLLEIAKSKEEGRDRRHREKMEMLEKLCESKKASNE